MTPSIALIIFYALLIDSIGANLVAWFGEDWYHRHLRIFSRYFPAAKGWAGLYLILVLIIGYLLTK